ncbi:N-acetyltransferase [Lactobacillus sp. 0.1XD8-4]|uniref:N-acetyltransferase n=1 Tax=Limosilactobacillus walteri TaxID=2268022 RepID=A0ABR8P6V0_9LACO|nr:GNAT family N-acetyltransferase [Limosilactobacillus walteri]MBD5806471.1 N-acetyltransferase [Limosilactobacillus walteri]MRN06131.1 N-acetyltransferase [Lactobacillus sp. 0.1XD8-4]
MQYRVDGQRIVAFDDQEPFVGEISFPKVPDTDDRVVVERVFVQPAYRGQGIAAELVRRFVEYATEQHYTVKLMCPYAVAQFKLHPEYQQLLLATDRFN